MERSLLLHVGYQKTGSTWLQRHFFSGHPDIQFLGKPASEDSRRALFELQRSILQEPEASFRPNKIRRKVETLFESLGDHEEPIALSLEQLSGGHLWIGEHHPYVAQRLRNIFRRDSVKIIVGVRNQLSILPSFYAQYLKHGGLLSRNQFLFSPQYRGKVFLDALKYDHFLKQYSRWFGSENLFIYLQEELAHAPEDCLRSLCDFAGVGLEGSSLENERTNTRPSPLALGILRVMNHFFYSRENPAASISPVTLLLKPLLWLMNRGNWYEPEANSWAEHPLEESRNRAREFRLHVKLRKKLQGIVLALDRTTGGIRSSARGELSEELSSYLISYYAESNERLRKTFDLPLDQYDYPLPER